MFHRQKKSENFAKLISSIQSTMSDLGPVNPLFNTELNVLRETLLPKAIDLIQIKQVLLKWVTFFVNCIC